MRGLKIKLLVVVLLSVFTFSAVEMVIEETQNMLAGILGIEQTSQTVEISGNKALSAEVLALKSIVEKEAQAAEIPSEVPFLLAIMMVESGGRGSDPMQSSESGGLSPNSISSVEWSIRQGVKHYKTTLELAKRYGLENDKKAIVQAYNFGSSYVSWLGNSKKKHSVDEAETYSRTVVAPSQRTNGYPNAGQKYSYVNEVSKADGRTYLYRHSGNFFYAELVYQYIDNTESRKSSNGAYVLPVDNPVISSGFGWRSDPFGGGTAFHRGLDFANPFGSNIKAIAAGKVITAGPHYSWGNHIVIQHENGQVSLYAHLNKILATVGQTVKQGQTIGQLGSTGNSTGPHLHLEIAKSSDLSQANLIDPAVALGLK
ncbi:lysozyme family protein [Enterococcus faecium]|uniref:lysozyme family protein n=1 Tax=Enterococcus faecium TaxID=1352 RepID=UPI000A185E91|nr:lysozyme family protein [Enterococcus faecium]MCE3178520.1 lysozyme family protein [Enterococcus faecium]MCE3184032.1 lysozyme family protein [Enterococcus faecium]MCU2104489.1 lysozyme family protein [Enterococcus faecium]MCU2185790.1 lysozyme family protein [Enterococcus faecium]MCU2188676.1 lysozyme family protein [Enterococcus faecium]